MPEVKQKFSYKAREESTGALKEGVVEAPSADAVEKEISRRGYDPYDVKPISNTGLNMEISFGGKKRVKPKDVAVFARQFSSMVDAGIPLLTALNILTKQSENPTLRQALGDMRTDIESGLSLADAMKKHPKIFSDLIVNMVYAGEEGGFLDETMRQVAKNLEKEIKLRSKIKSAMTYPVVVLMMAILMGAGMLLFIVPVFSSMFASLGGELPLPTKILVVASNFLKVGIVPVIIGIVAGVIWWRKNSRKLWVRNIKDPLMLKLPVFGNLVQKIVLSRFTRNLATLLGSGVPIIKALDIVGDTTGSVVVSRALDQVKASVSNGDTIHGPLREHAVFPPMVPEMIAVGEEAGSIDGMLEKIADFYDDEVEATTEALTSLIEPLMIVVLGVFIGSMIISLYLPIFSVFDLIQ